MAGTDDSNWFAEMSLGAQGVPTGSFGNMYSYTPPKAPVYDQPTIKKKPRKDPVETNYDFLVPKLPALTKEQKAAIEAEEKLRKDAENAYNELLKINEQKYQEAKQKWWKLSLVGKLIHFISFFNPGLIDRSLNCFVEDKVDGVILYQMSKILPNSQLIFGLEKMQMILMPLNRIAGLIFRPTLILIASLIIALLTLGFANQHSDSVTVGIFAFAIAFYSFNISKIILIWLTTLFFNFVYKLGTLLG